MSRRDLFTAGPRPPVVSPRFPTVAEARERRRLAWVSRITVVARFALALFCIGLVTVLMPDMGPEAKLTMTISGFLFIACCVYFIVTDPKDRE